MIRTDTRLWLRTWHDHAANAWSLWPLVLPLSYDA